MRSPPPSSSHDSSPTRRRPVARNSCSKRGPPMRSPSSCVARTWRATSSSVPLSHGGAADRMSTSSSTGTSSPPLSPASSPSIWAWRRRLHRHAVDPQPPVHERLDQLERQRAGAEDAGLAVGADRVVHLAGAVHVEHPTVGEREVHLDVVGVPLVGDGLDADAGHAELGALVPDPGVHRLAHLGIVGLRREHVLAVVGQSTRVVDRHDLSLVLRRAGGLTPSAAVRRARWRRRRSR